MHKTSINKLKVFTLIVSVLFLLFSSINSAWASDAKISPNVYKQLKYRFIGPQGNRVIAVVGIPGNPNIYYAGAASGGIFKSTDGGTHWKPIFDKQPAASIGSLAAAPSDPNIIWAGTGEISIRSNISQGMGIFKSTDSGKTWIHMGLEKTGRIGRIIIDPHNPDIVFAAAMGHCYGPQEERGIFRTTDGGKTWERVLFVDQETGCSDIVMDPNNSRILFSGMWPMRIWSWLERRSGGPGGGIYTSRDGGTIWTHLTGHGLPEAPLGKIALAISPHGSNRIYALIESPTGVLWRSDDGGKNWKLVNQSHILTMRPAYYTRCAVAPDDENEIYFLATNYSLSLDGGETHKIFKGPLAGGGDNHDMWIDPMNPDRMIVGHDGGISISVNHGKSWQRIILPVAQMYHVAVDNQIPYFVYGNRQDGPSTRGPSNSLTGRSISSGMWHSVGGCECGFAVPDPVDNNIIWSGCYEGMIDRFDLRTGHSRSVSVWPDSFLGWAAEKLKYRFQWTFPITISPHNHNKIYVGSQFVHQTTDDGQIWTIISPDLSTNDKSKQRPFGGITRDDESTYSCCIFALSESALEEGLIWAGTNDGQVHLTRDGGKIWTNVTKNIPNLPPMGIVSNIEPSKYDSGSCYITVDLHNANNRNPYAYKTTDYGKSWAFITSSIPKSELSYAHCIREDPVRKGLLYLGTENALYVSFDDGVDWLPLQLNLPHAPVHWLVVQEHFNDLVVATYGRGFWILDDITPLQEMNQEALKSDAYLFPPRPSYRFRKTAGPMQVPNDLCTGKNSPYGASINYYIRSTPKSNVKITILDENDQTIKTLKGTKETGVNRIWWDLKYEKSKTVKLRTSPIGSPYVTTGPKAWRPMVSMAEPIEILAPPRIYTVKLKVGENTLSRKLEVRKDPHSIGSDSDIQSQVKLLLEIRDNMNSLVEIINQVEWIRKQIYDLIDVLKENKNNDPIIDTGRNLDQRLIDIEENFFQMRLTGSTDDALRAPCRLYYKLSSLASGVGLADFPPTAQQIQVHKMFTEEILSYQKNLQEIAKKDLADFNTLLENKKLHNIIYINTQVSSDNSK